MAREAGKNTATYFESKAQSEVKTATLLGYHRSNKDNQKDMPARISY